MNPMISTTSQPPLILTRTTRQPRTASSVGRTLPRAPRASQPTGIGASAAGSAGCAVQADAILDTGEVAEWLKAAVLKTAGRKSRGFESHPLRHTTLTGPRQAGQPTFTRERSRRRLPSGRWQDRGGRPHHHAGSDPGVRRPDAATRLLTGWYGYAAFRSRETAVGILEPRTGPQHCSRAPERRVVGGHS